MFQEVGILDEPEFGAHWQASYGFYLKIYVEVRSTSQAVSHFIHIYKKLQLIFFFSYVLRLPGLKPYALF